MAVAMETIIQHRSNPVTDLNEFLVPTILSVNLKKKLKDRSMNPGEFIVGRKHGGGVNKRSKPVHLIENVEKNLPKIIDNEIPTATDLDHLEHDEQDVTDMAPERHRDKGGQKPQSSYLLQPFFKPVAQNVGGSAVENPILKALFGGGNPAPETKPFYNWVSGDRPSINNYHPFKKSESLINHSQVPKSLPKDPQKAATPRSKYESSLKLRPTQNAFKDVTHQSTGNIVKGATVESSPQIDKPQPKSKSSSEKENCEALTSDEVLKQIQSKVQNKVKGGSATSLKRIGYVNSEKLIKLRTLVDNAIKNHKVYSMTGCYNSVRNALKQRGWIEKIDSDIKGKRKQNKFEEIGIYDAAFQFVQKYPTLAAMRYSVHAQSGFSHNDQINYSGQGEAEIINRMLKNINEDLCWLSRPYPYYCWKDIGKFDLVNRLPKAYFSNKIGLCNSLQHIQWYFEPGVCTTQYPRTYNMSQKDEYDAFKEDFRMTACIGLLKWLTSNYRNEGEKAVRSAEGKVDACIIDFALKRCSDFVRYKEHEDIDLPDGPVVWDHQWDHFIAQYYKIINDGHLLKECKSDPSVQVYVTNALAMLSLIKPHWPQLNIDGYQNFWVVKPGGRCCGNGIVIKNNLEQILMLVNPTVTRETRYVVQKYIERPLLIYNTKFDIRQWFLVTSVYPLTVWMYRESYLRFCSQPFSLKSTHESIHLCNNAVQRRYKNSKRDRGLPDENMWDCYTFQTYLKSIGYPDAWEKHIYPGMKEGFIGALLASQDTMERRKNCFELYGADFMISETLTDGPWLIEINSNPAMDSSTSVTGRMCPQVLEDIVKVVIDRRDDKNASTGAFEMVFKQQCPPVPPYLGMSLSIKGQKMNRNGSGEIKSFDKKSKSPNSSGKLLPSEFEDLLSDYSNNLQCSVESSYQSLRNKVDSSPRINASGYNKLSSPTLSMELLDGLKREILRAKISIRMMQNRENNKSRDRHLQILPDQKITEDMCVSGERTPIQTLSSRMDRIVQESPRSCTIQRETVYLSQIIEQKTIAQKKESKTKLDEDPEVFTSVDCPDIGDPSRITESVEADGSEHSIYTITEEEFENEIFKETSKGNSCLEVKEAERKSDDPAMDAVSYKTAQSEIIENESQPENISLLEQPEKVVCPSKVPENNVLRQKKANPQACRLKQERWKMRKKIDWVRKNIEDLRALQNKGKNARKPQVQKKENTSPRLPVWSRKVSSDAENYAEVYRDELLKIFFSTDSRKFIQQLIGGNGRFWKSYVQVRTGRRSPNKIQNVVEVFKRDGNTWKRGLPDGLGERGSKESPKDAKVEMSTVCGAVANRFGVSQDLYVWGSKPTPEGLLPNPQCIRVTSCPDIQLSVDESACARKESSLNADLVRGRSDGCLKKDLETPSDKSVDWKKNVESARRACHEILTKLREFNESNTKVRLQEALKQGIKVDSQPKTKRKQGMRDWKASSLSVEVSERRRVRKKKNQFSTKSDSNLAINRESGAVRKVNKILPKVNPWSFLLFDKSSTG